MRRRVRRHIDDHHAALIVIEIKRFGQLTGQVLTVDAQAAPTHLAKTDQVVLNALDHVGRDGETDANVATRGTDNRRIDADQATLQIHQRTTGVAGIDRSVGLDEIFEVFDAKPTAPECADDARGDGLTQSERIADRHNKIAHPERMGVSPRHRAEVIRLNANQRDVRLRVSPDQTRGQLASITQRDENLVSRLDHVVVGDDVTLLGIDDHPGAETLRDVLTWLLRHIKKPPEERVVQ